MYIQLLYIMCDNTFKAHLYTYMYFLNLRQIKQRIKMYENFLFICCIGSCYILVPIQTNIKYMNTIKK